MNFGENNIFKNKAGLKPYKSTNRIFDTENLKKNSSLSKGLNIYNPLFDIGMKSKINQNKTLQVKRLKSSKLPSKTNIKNEGINFKTIKNKKKNEEKKVEKTIEDKTNDLIYQFIQLNALMMKKYRDLIKNNIS